MLISASKPARRLASPVITGLLITLAACSGDSGSSTAGLTAPTSPQVASIDVSPAQAALQVDSTVQLSATARDAQGNVMSGISFAWKVDNDSVATVDHNGVVTGQAPGDARVTASADNVVGTGQLKVRSGVTVVADSTQLSLVSDSAERAAGLYRFQVVQGSPPAIKEGDILVGGQDGGFLRRVTSVSTSGNIVTAQTVQAALADAVQDDSFQTQVSLGPGTTTPSAQSAAGVVWGRPRLVSKARGVSISDGGLSLDGLVLIDGQVCSASGSDCADVSLSLPSGEVAFTPEVDVGGKIGFYSIDEFHAIASGDLSYDLTMALTASGTFQAKGETPPLAEFEQPFVVPASPAGGLPIFGFVRLEFKAGYTASAGVAGTISSGFKSSFGLKVGEEYQEGAWNQVFDPTSSFTALPISGSLSGTASVRIYIQPEIDVILYGVAGPFVYAEPYLQGDATLDQTCATYALTAGLDAGVGGEVDILSTTLLRYEEEFDVAERSIGSGQLGCAVRTARIYASSGEGTGSPPSDLWIVPPWSGGVDTLVARVKAADGSEPVITDLARAPDGSLWGTSFNRLWRIDSLTAQATPVMTYGSVSDVNALAFDANGGLFAATLGGSLVKIDLQQKQDNVIGPLGSQYQSWGDLVFGPDGTLYAMVLTTGGKGILVSVDPSTGSATPISGSDVGFDNVWGLAFVGNTLYGLTADPSSGQGALITIDTTTGIGTFVRPLQFSAFGAGASAARGAGG